MTELLPVGTRIHVTPYDSEPDNRPYFAIVRGYDMGRTKYRVSPRIMGWSEYFYPEWAHDWPFPSQCRPIEPGEDGDAADDAERTNRS